MPSCLHLSFFFFTSSEKLLERFVFSFSKSFGKRTLSRPIQSVIILVNEQIGPQLRSCPISCNQLYGYSLNWTPLSPVTIINHSSF